MNPKFIPYTIILLLLYVIFFLQQCQPKHKCPVVKSDTVTVTRIDSIPFLKAYPRSYPVYVSEPSALIDTAAILASCMETWNDYSTLKVYARQLLDDSTGQFSIMDSVQYNTLLGYSVNGHWNAITHVQTVTQSVPNYSHVQFFAGLQLGSDMQKFSFIPSVYMVTASNHFYSIGYNPFDKVGYLGLAWKLHF